MLVLSLDLAFSVGLGHLKGSKRQNMATVVIPLADLTISNDWDLEYRVGDQTPFKQTVLSADSYRIQASFPASAVSQNKPVTWCVRRVGSAARMSGLAALT